ncbi:Ornithine aminotransferase [Taphrina deformans PYCC 5710]|uniref:Ornithine aminotransferase n=1 Tax=Taphrina deformans (strain PYCC 5710 / ATCC 11124 / CBS 356.35 / IMI 108563 / JCM 9778 / NBRC 8474) TaxID=1097556 RepID=R4X7G2_TAPDE|nr:Ornithine aminotransferase [Taphrina deformans PYCC 5710]|eukprot:CCG81331.1 Ornithine aminotransferase [Taphrina deformans PYCC 5710]
MHGGVGDTEKSKTLKYLNLEREYSAHNYTPLPVVFARAQGAKVWDCDGKEYWDFGGSYCAVNQGHSHPEIVEALVKQSQTLALSSRAFTHDLFGEWSRFICQTFDYEKVLPLNGGAEVVEAATKLARSWGYTSKGIPDGQAVVLNFQGNYHGRTVLATSMSTTPNARLNYGPYTPGVGPHWDTKDPTKVIRYNHIEDLEEALNVVGKQVCAIIVESIQGEAGVIVPKDGYLQAIKALCKKHNVLYIADEIQVGLGRAGHMVYCESQGVKADVLLLAKSISGGLYPTSVMLSSTDLMACIHPNSHGATFSGSPTSCAVSRAAVSVLMKENLCQRSVRLGTLLMAGLKQLKADFQAIRDIRGAGLLIAIDIDPTFLSSRKHTWNLWHLSMLLLQKKIIAKLVQTNTLKLTPPLVISDQGIRDCLQALRECFTELPELSEIPGAAEFNSLGGSSTLA